MKSYQNLNITLIRTLRKKVEALRESEEKFKNIFDNASDGILLADLTTKKFVVANKTICNMLGYSEAELTKLTVNDIHPKKDLPYVLGEFKKQSQKKRSLTENLPVQRKDGSVFYVDINAVPVTFGGKTYLAGIFRDITERKKAEEVLRESEAKYKTLLENLPQKIFFKDRNSVYISCNKNYARDLKIKPEQIVGKTDLAFYPKKLARKYQADDRRIMKTKKIEDIEEEYVQNGKKVFVRTIKTPVKDENGEVRGILGTFWEIVPHKGAGKTKR